MLVNSTSDNVQFPQASLIKIPILMVVFKHANEGKFSLSEQRAVTLENLVGGTGILKNRENPSALSIKNLGIFLIALSDH